MRAILEDKDGGFAPRALTRDVNSAKAKELAALGAEVVAANVDDVESLKKAFAGAYGAYCVTFFWEHVSPEREAAQAKAMADAAAACRSPACHLVHARRHAEMRAAERQPDADADGQIQGAALRRQGREPITCSPTPKCRPRYLLTPFYWDNFINFGMGPRKGPDGKLVLAMPMGERKARRDRRRGYRPVRVRDLQEGPGIARQEIGIHGEALTGAQMAAQLSAALGQPVEYQAVPFDVYRGLGFPGADDIGNMFQFYVEFEKEFLGARDVGLARALNPKLQDFRTWLAPQQGKDSDRGLKEWTQKWR